MHSRFAAAIFISLASAATVLAANGFMEICGDVVVLAEANNNYVLEATCRTTSGQEVVSSINLNSCVGFQVGTGLVCRDK